VATQYYIYTDDAGTAYGVSLTDAQQSLYPTVVGALPTAYSTLAALQAANPSAQVFPTGLVSRYINVTTAIFGTVQLVVLSKAAFALIEPTGSSPFPTTPVSFTLTVSITGASGETRLTN
jgi:hypothetical protein